MSEKTYANGELILDWRDYESWTYPHEDHYPPCYDESHDYNSCEALQIMDTRVDNSKN